MKNSQLIPVGTFFMGVLLTATGFIIFRKHDNVKNIVVSTFTPLTTSVVYNTVTEGYYFSMHDNSSLMDRSNAKTSEAFIVQIAPEKFTQRHIYDDTDKNLN